MVVQRGSGMKDDGERALILLVDDDDEVRGLLRRGLERVGFRVFAVSDERDAVQIINHQSPDLILMELGRVSPEESLAVGKRIKAGAGLPQRVPVVAYAGAEDGIAREGEVVEVAPGEYVLLPDEAEQLTSFLLRLVA